MIELAAVNMSKFKEFVYGHAGATHAKKNNDFKSYGTFAKAMASVTKAAIVPVAEEVN